MKNVKSNEDDETQQLMADSVLEQSEGKEVKFACHVLASQALDTLIGHSTPEIFEKFTSSLMSDLRLIVNDTSGSFVLEACVKIGTLRALAPKEDSNTDNTTVDDEPSAKRKKFSRVSSDIDYNLKTAVKHSHKMYCQQLVEKISKFLLNNLEDYLQENHAGHLIRKCILSLAGMVYTKSNFKAPELINVKTQHDRIIPDTWSSIVADFVTRISMWPHFGELAFEESSSVVLQTLCQALKNLDCQQDTLKKLVKSIMKKSFKDDEESEIAEEDCKAFVCPASLHLLESMMQSCDQKSLNKIYKKYFKEKLAELSESSHLNYTVQRLIDAMGDKEIYEEMFSTLSPNIASLLQIGHTGVVLAICKGCERLGVKQGLFIQNLLKALECGAEKTNKCIWPIITLLPLSVIEKDEAWTINLNGSLILQSIFRFNKPIKIIQALVDGMKPQDIADIFCDPRGSRIADAYLESKYIGEKSREKLIKHMEGMYLAMAVSKNGSHVLEKFYNLSSDSQKENIAKELSERVNQLNGCVSGRIINYKFSVETYARNPNQWRSYLARPGPTTEKR